MAYPTSVDAFITPASKYSTKPLTVTLLGLHDAATATLNLNEDPIARGLAATYGVVRFEDEKIFYTAADSGTMRLTGCTRGYQDSDPAQHAGGTEGSARIETDFVKELQAAVLALENELGFSAAPNYVRAAGSLAQTIGGVKTFTDAVVLGSTPALSGLVRLPKAQPIKARNNANSADLPLIQGNVSDQAELGSASVNVYVPGKLLLAGDPVDDLGAVTKQMLATYMPKAGGTFTGAVTLAADPTVALHAATKQWVESLVGAAGVIATSGAAPYVMLTETDQVADEKKWQMYVDAKVLSLRSVNDALGAPANILTATRGAGSAISTVGLYAAGVERLRVDNEGVKVTAGAATGTADILKLIDTLNNTGTGYLVNVDTASGSALKPFRVGWRGESRITVSAAGAVAVHGSNLTVIDPPGAFGVDVHSSGNVELTYAVYNSSGGICFGQNAGSIAFMSQLDGAGASVRELLYFRNGTDYSLDVRNGGLLAGGNIRNKTAADASPYTRARLTAYNDGTNWGYVGYGSDAVMRLVYGNSATGNGYLMIGRASGADGTGTFSEYARFNPAGLFSLGAAETGTDQLSVSCSTATYSQLSLRDTRAYSTPPEAKMVFAVKYNEAQTYSDIASIVGAKANVTDGNNAGQLLLRTRVSGGVLTTALTLKEDQVAVFAAAVELVQTVTTVNPTAPNRTIAIKVNGTTYYIPAKTTND